MTPILLSALLLVIFGAIYYTKQQLKSDLGKENLNGKIKFIETLTYSTFEGEKDKLIDYELNKYNVSGNKDFSIINSEDESYKLKYLYDDKGKKIKREKYNLLNELLSTYNYQYDLKGNIIEEDDSKNSQNKCGGIVLEDSYSYKSELDDKSNWIKQTRYNEDGFADLITEKNIVYYGDKDEKEYSNWESIDYKGREIYKE